MLANGLSPVVELGERVLVHGLLILCYGLVGAGAGLWLSHAGVAADSSAAVLAAALVVVAGALAHAAGLSHAARRRLGGRLAALKVGQRDLATELEGARRQMVTLLAELERRHRQAEERAKEVQELRDLVRRLARKVDATGQAAPLGVASMSHLPRRLPAYPPVAGAAPATAAARTPLVAVPPATPEPVIELPPPQILPAASDEELHQIDRIREALERRRVVLFVQPVVRLPQRRREFYEAFTRLRARDGSYIPPEAYLEIAGRAGLLAAIDNILLFRCIEQLHRDLGRNVSARYFCNLSARTLADETFFPQLQRYLESNERLTAHLVFELSQADLRALDAKANRRLDLLAAAGFSLAMDQVTDLDLDPAALAKRHFGYVKLDAAALLPEVGGEPTIDLEGLHESLERAGIALIVEKIESEDMLLDLLDYKIDYGQGYLFGEPRKGR